MLEKEIRVELTSVSYGSVANQNVSKIKLTPIQLDTFTNMLPLGGVTLYNTLPKMKITVKQWLDTIQSNQKVHQFQLTN